MSESQKLKYILTILQITLTKLQGEVCCLEHHLNTREDNVSSRIYHITIYLNRVTEEQEISLVCALVETDGII